MKILLTGATGYIAQRLLPALPDIRIFDSQTDIQRHVDEAMKICLVLKKTDLQTK